MTAFGPCDVCGEIAVVGKPCIRRDCNGVCLCSKAAEGWASPIVGVRGFLSFTPCPECGCIHRSRVEKRAIEVMNRRAELPQPPRWVCSAKCSGGLFGFYCTLPEGHDGDHVASGSDGRECARWSESGVVGRPRCPVCGDWCIDGKATCGRVTCGPSTGRAAYASPTLKYLGKVSDLTGGVVGTVDDGAGGRQPEKP